MRYVETEDWMPDHELDNIRIDYLRELLGDGHPRRSDEFRLVYGAWRVILCKYKSW